MFLELKYGIIEKYQNGKDGRACNTSSKWTEKIINKLINNKFIFNKTN